MLQIIRELDIWFYALNIWKAIAIVLAVIVVWAAMTADLIEKNAPSGAYNIGSGDSRPLRSYIEQMKEITRSTSQLNFGAIPYYKNTVLHVQPDMKKTFDTIGKRKLISFDDGIGSILKDDIS